MRKFLLLVFAFMILTATVEAAGIPDVRSIAPDSIVIKKAIPADENSAGVYEYRCKDGNTMYYFDKYIQLLVENGFVVIDGKQLKDDGMIQGLIYLGEDIPVFDFDLGLNTPVHVLVEGAGSKLQVQVAPGISYGE